MEASLLLDRCLHLALVRIALARDGLLPRLRRHLSRLNLVLGQHHRNRGAQHVRDRIALSPVAKEGLHVHVIRPRRKQRVKQTLQLQAARAICERLVRDVEHAHVDREDLARRVELHDGEAARERRVKPQDACRSALEGGYGERRVVERILLHLLGRRLRPISRRRCRRGDEQIESGCSEFGVLQPRHERRAHQSLAFVLLELAHELFKRAHGLTFILNRVSRRPDGRAVVLVHVREHTAENRFVPFVE
mmetsp:Transcript_33382/g.66428  ORF Transcript_33382/g.66428 Transcript_33382/m.66428 type:complete len:249 (+) Transcript_33382:575-1321(+)